MEAPDPALAPGPGPVSGDASASAPAAIGSSRSSSSSGGGTQEPPPQAEVTEEEKELLPHQVEGVRWMLERERDGSNTVVRGGILADDMGLGKTVQVARLLLEHPLPTLIVTTSSTLAQWRDELFHTLRRRATSLNALTAAELPMEVHNAQVYITSYNVIFTIAERAKKRNALDPRRSVLHRHWGRVVLDEAHFVRNRNTLHFKAIIQLSADHRWALTGTPINNRIKDLGTLSEWVGVPLVGEPENQRRYILRRTTESLLRSAGRGGAGAGKTTRPLPSAPPSLTTTVELVDFRHAEERELYTRIERMAASSLTSGGSSDDVRAALMKTADSGRTNHNRAMEGITRLRQACVHPRLYAEGVTRSHRKRAVDAAEDADPQRLAEEEQLIGLAEAAPGGTKMACIAERVARDCAEDDGVKVIVFCEWLREMEMLEEALRRTRHAQLQEASDADRDIYGSGCVKLHGSLPPCDRAMRVMAFNDAPAPREPRVLLAQIHTGGVGLNLQAASRVYVTCPKWNPCNELQAISRAYRHGQTREVRCTRLVMRDTIEERCVEKQRLKLGYLDGLMTEGGGLLATTTSASSLAPPTEDDGDEMKRENKKQKKNEDMIMMRRMGYA